MNKGCDAERIAEAMRGPDIDSQGGGGDAEERSRSVFADGVTSYTQGDPGPDSPFGNWSNAIGEPDWDRDRDTGFVSLGCKGAVTLSFSSGPALKVGTVRVYEIGPAVEATSVEILTGSGWKEIGTVAGSTSSLEISPPEVVLAVRLTDLEEECGMPSPGADIDAVELIGY